MDRQSRSLIPPDENLLFTKVLDRLFLCIENDQNTFTDFMDPIRTAQAAGRVKTGDYPVNIEVFGGWEDSERQMIGFSTACLTHEDFPITAIEIKYNAKFAGLTHRDFLGALCGLGIDRGKLGDVLVERGRAVAFVRQEICEYICANLDKAGNVKVTASRIDLPHARIETGEKKEARLIVSSMRLDSIISAAFHLSRAKSAAAINAEKALLNWIVVTDPSKAVKEGDVITLRGSGRLQLDRVEGHTKKGRQVVRAVIK